jgi:hypothetical protein
MDRVLSETKVTQRFTEHDLCAKVASDAESLERARALLSTPIPRTTQRSYRHSWSVVRLTQLPDWPTAYFSGSASP